MRFQSIVHYTLVLLSLSLAVTFELRADAQAANHFSRTLVVSGPVTLDATIAKGEITIVQGRDDHMVVTASLQGGRVRSDGQFPVAVEQDGGHIHFGRTDGLTDKEWQELDIAVRIEAPQRTEVTSSIERGKLTIVGIDGPIKANTTTGNIGISYALKEVSAQAESGDLDIEAVSGRVRAIVGRGNIACTRAPEGVSAEAGEGDINLRVVGPSEARVQRGGGRIDVGGARSTLVAITDAGDLHVKAVPHQDWELSSASGNIHIELPPAAGFEVDAVTKAGAISVRRRDMPDVAGNELTQRVNGGGARIRVRSEKGNVVID
jgi:hypothetical protein